MIIDFDNITASERYFAMVQSIVPRPIAWVLSDNGLVSSSVTKLSEQSPEALLNPARYNLAPFSFFTGICSDPPLLMLSVGQKTTGPESGFHKDTCVNIRERKHFVVHIASTGSLDAINQSAETLAHGESEIEKLGLPLVPFEGCPLPRLEQAPIAMHCSLYRLDTIGHAPQSIIYGLIHTLYVNDACVIPHDAGRLQIDAQAVQPLSRLGGKWYCEIGQLLEANRPK